MKQILFFILFTVHFVLYAQEKSEAVTYDVTYDIEAQKGTKKVRLICLIPQDIAQIQQVKNITYSHKPANVVDKNNNKYAEFIIENPSPQTEIKLSITLDLYPNDLKHKGMYTGEIGKLEKYVLPEKYIESDDAVILKTAQKLKKKSELQTVKNIFNFVTGHMRYSGYIASDVGAVKAFQLKHGDCTEHADLFVALCRANDIPARVMEGYTVNYTNIPQHNWAEVYLKEHGWTTFDPTIGPFATLQNHYIQLSCVRNDETLNNFHFYYYQSWGEPVKKVSSAFQIRTN